MLASPLLSIVAVTYQDISGIQRTLDSLAELKRQAGAALEVIVVDGGTSPDFVGLVEKSLDEVRVISEPDRGIYDAMNKGKALAKGDFVWFLNGGDACLLREWPALRDHLYDAGERITYFGFELDTGLKRVRRLPKPARYIWHALPTSHQAIVYPSSSLRRVEYDLRYRIVGDYALTLKLVASGTQTLRSRTCLARFNTGGASETAGSRLAHEVWAVQSELGVPLPQRLFSRALHAVSQIRRRRLTASPCA